MTAKKDQTAAEVPADDPNDPTSRAYRKVVAEIGPGLEIWHVHIDGTREQDVNARAMGTAMMTRLQQTIERDQRLESLPLLAATDRGLEIVSGHHRTRAARSAGVQNIFAIVDTTGLTPSQIKAKQLAHNAISGTDDATLVEALYREIEDVDARLESFIDPKELDLSVPDRVPLPKMDIDLAFHSVLLMFMPSEKEAFDRAAQQVIDMSDLNRDELWLVDREMQALWTAAMNRFRKEYGVRSANVVLSRVLKAAAAHLGLDATPEEIDPDDWVPLTEIVGTALVPPDAAEVLRQAVEKVTAAEQIPAKNAWRVLEFLAADYLAGA